MRVFEFNECSIITVTLNKNVHLFTSLMTSFFCISAMMILGHGANTMTLDEARIKLCAQAK